MGRSASKPSFFGSRKLKMIPNQPLTKTPPSGQRQGGCSAQALCAKGRENPLNVGVRLLLLASDEEQKEWLKAGEDEG